jgi:hypothetical protein
MDSFGEIHAFLYLNWIGLFEWREHSSTLKHLSCREYSFLKLSLFSQGNNVVDDPDSNTDGFLSRSTCVSQLCWIGLFRKKWEFFHLERYDLQEVFLSKTTSTLIVNKCAMCWTSNIGGFHRRDTCVSSTQMNRPFWRKQMLSPPWNTCIAGNLAFKINSILTGKQCTRCCSY